MVVPILCYGSELWGFEYSPLIENVQNAFCRKYLKLPQNAFHAFAQGECGRYPLCVTYYCRCVKYWVRVTRMGHHRFPYQSYMMLKRLDEVGRTTWATKVKTLLYKYGFGYVWLAHEVGDIRAFMLLFKQRLIDCMTQDWRSVISDSRKAIHYKYFKSMLTVEHYLKIDIPEKYRIALSRFRCSTHSLMVEVGRHTNVLYDERLCTFCNIPAVEYEFHMLMVCQGRRKHHKIDPANYCRPKDLYIPVSICHCVDRS